ncbi:MAG TPA: Clp protease N-terminal domain-containing protein [Candidatus Microsaccharimonas sp.]|jgi:ATP-dependent Clp protease ATP-binding subunit ClpA
MQLYELASSAELLFKRTCAVSTRLRHYYVEPEHFLLAAIIDVDSRIARIMNNYGMTVENVLDVVIDMHEQYPEGHVRVIEPFSPVSTKIVNRAIAFAQERDGQLATDADIVTMLLLSKDEQVLHVFDTLDVNPDRIGVEVVRLLLTDAAH